ncbi:hypothetical protein PLANPX_5158 [Lacipirellula parvula]|uniref:Uncharacterized protein n=1 Tax=Lacipirellula parvula TaxID=2650471 RepID=A0A5K7XLL3_9BACT|nr:hypothetical protein PLANPX_5158 [Lacipirellula parvula]
MKSILALLLTSSTANAAPLQHRSLPMRQVALPARPTYCAPKVIIYVVPVRQPRAVYYGGGFNPYSR